MVSGLAGYHCVKIYDAVHRGVLVYGTSMGGCKLRATGLENFLALHELYEVHKFNGCFDLQRDLQLIAEIKRGFIEALHRQNCPLLVAPERFH
jgi:hypothetical protein